MASQLSYLSIRGFSVFKCLITPSIAIVIVCALTACGGGGGGDNSNTLPAPKDLTSITLTKPNYTGTTELKPIGSNQVAKLALDLTIGFDLLHVISFADVYEYFLIHPDDGEESNEDSDINCLSGSASVKEVSLTHLEVIYNQCVQGGVVANGLLNLYVTRVYDSQLMDMNIIPDLTMVDRASGETLNINGYIQVRQSNVSDFQHKATYQILLTNEEDEQFYFNNFIAQVSTWGDRYGIDYSGEILSTEYGKLALDTTKLYGSNLMGFELTVNAENTAFISVLLGKQLNIDIGPESIPLIIDLNNIPQSFLDDVNEAPRAALTASIASSERMSDITLSATESSDPDLDLLDYQWSITSAPVNATWTIENNASPNFSADLPGEYSVQLTVTDAQGLENSVTTLINIEKSAPDFSIILDTNIVSVDTVASGQVSLNNDEYDGPFEYNMVYGPFGMSIDVDGKIHWPAHIMDFGTTTNVNFAIAVSNSDKTATMSSVLPVTSAPSFIENNAFKDIRNILPTDWSSSKQVFAHQGKEQLLGAIDIFNTFSSHTFLNDNNLIDVKLAKSSLADGYSYAASYDVDKDGIIDHFLATENFINGEHYWYLWLEDGDSGKLTQVVTMNNQLSTNNKFGYFTFDDIDGDGEIEMTISTYLNYGQVRQVHSYDLASFALERIIEAVNGEHVGYCDIDQDGVNDVITSNEIYSLKTGNLITKTVNEGEDIQLVKTGSRCLLLSSNNIYKFDEGSLVSLPTVIESRFFVGNFDNDIDQEVIFAEYQSLQNDKWFLGNIDIDGNISKIPLAIPDDINFEDYNTNFGFHGVLAVIDFNGDGVDELLAFGTHTNTQGLSAISLQGNDLVEKYSGVTFDYDYEGLVKIAQYHQDNTVTVNKTDAAIRLNAASHWVDFGKDDGWAGGDILTTEVVNDELFYYASLPYPVYDGGIARYDSDGVMLWSNSIDTSFYTDITLTKESLLIQENEIAYIVNKATGDFTNANFGSLMSSPEHFSFQIFLDKSTYVFYQLENNLLSTVLNNDDFNYWGKNLNIPLNQNVQFIQYDDDEQVEVIFNYYQLNEEGSNVTKYDIVDGLNWEKETLTLGLSGYQSENSFGVELQTCFIADSTCRNKIISTSNHIEIRDKITNKLIYQSPQYPSNIKDLAIRHDMNGHIRFSLLINNNVTVFH